MNEMISVIVPIFNVEKFLPECIESILNQTYRNIEVILVDDESPDNCGKICDDYAKKDDRVQVIHKKNGGLSDARNAGLEVFRGEFVTFIDSDDYIETIFLETLYNLIKKHNCSISQVGTKRIDENGRELNLKLTVDKEFLILDKREVVVGLLTRTLNCSSCCNLYTKAVFEKVRFTKGKLNEDLLMWSDLVYVINNMAIVNTCLYNYRERRGSLTTSLSSVRCYRDAIDNAELWKEKLINHGIELGDVPDYNIMYYCLVYLKLYGHYDNNSREIIYKVRKMIFKVKERGLFTLKERVSLMVLVFLPQLSIPLLHMISFKNR